MLNFNIQEKRFGDRLIIENLKYNFEFNNIYGIVSKNGSGKTTLLNILSGIDAEYIGNIELNGVPVLPLKKNYVSYMPQDINIVVHPWMSVYENLLFPALQPSQEFFDHVIKELELEKYLLFSASELSGGFLQRLAIAKCLLKNEASAYLFDEPFSAQDIWSKQKIKRCIKKHLQEKQCTMVIVSHDISDLMSMCNYILLFEIDFRCQPKVLSREEMNLLINL